MNVILAFALFSILLLGAPVFAQNPCVDCLKSAQDQLKQCLDHAISQEDKKSCAERQEAKRRSAKRANARLKEPRIRIEMMSSQRRNNGFVR
jgi:hypothetical protein